uniref:Uncharacterized protein n=1 Tax=Steinernema glaseri TaxID=37863 RepID=A0A1I7ZIX0_9BILA
MNQHFPFQWLPLALASENPFIISPFPISLRPYTVTFPFEQVNVSDVVVAIPIATDLALCLHGPERRAGDLNWKSLFWTRIFSG